MNNVDVEYFRLANLVLENGRVKKNRTGVDTIGIFGEQAKFDLSEGFPILTTKKVFMKGIIHELLWFIKGDTNIKYLVDNDVHIWDEWAYAKYKKVPLEKLPSSATSLIDQNFVPNNQKEDDTNRRYATQKEFIEEIKNSPTFAAKWGELGEGTYGGMWRAFPYVDTWTDYYDCRETVDQIEKLINKLKTNPDDRRLIVSAWHPYWVDHCALPPCHCLFQFHTEELTVYERYEISGIRFEMDYIQKYGEEWGHKKFDEENVPRRRLNCQLYQRSCDLGLGIPFNIASYSLLTAMIAHVVGMTAGVFIHTYGDLHIYQNHIEQIKEQMTRESFNLPKLWLNPQIKSLYDFKYEDIKLLNYESHASIKMDVAV